MAIRNFEMIALFLENGCDGVTLHFTSRDRLPNRPYAGCPHPRLTRRLARSFRGALCRSVSSSDSLNALPSNACSVLGAGTDRIRCGTPRVVGPRTATCSTRAMERAGKPADFQSAAHCDRQVLGRPPRINRLVPLRHRVARPSLPIYLRASLLLSPSPALPRVRP